MSSILQNLKEQRAPWLLLRCARVARSRSFGHTTSLDREASMMTLLEVLARLQLPLVLYSLAPVAEARVMYP